MPRLSLSPLDVTYWWLYGDLTWKYRLRDVLFHSFHRFHCLAGGFD
jgi:hypothetical protein